MSSPTIAGLRSMAILSPAVSLPGTTSRAAPSKAGSASGRATSPPECATGAHHGDIHPQPDAYREQGADSRCQRRTMLPVRLSSAGLHLLRADLLRASGLPLRSSADRRRPVLAGPLRR